MIELLVVIAIIALLAGLALPALNGAIQSGRKAQARNDVQQIVAAVKAFQAEYGRMPTALPPGTDPNNEWSDAYHQGDNNQVMRILMGQNTTFNPRSIVFISPKSVDTMKGGVNRSSFIFYDPWGIPYAIKLDNNYSGKIEYYGSGGQPNIFHSAMALSFGPDRQQGNPYAATGTGKDDICSFK